MTLKCCVSVLLLISLSAEVRGACNQTTGRNGTAGGGTGDFRPLVLLSEAVLMTLGFGLFAGLVALAFTLVRKHVYHDQDDLDTTFDAGGQVSVGLTATTIVSQWTWAATLLQSCTVASKFGISGPFWYAAGASVQIIVFAILSIEMKMKAPGAKTYLQVIKARFGPKAHVVFCVFALLTNVLVTGMLLLGGIASITALVNGLSTETAAICLAIVIGSYTLIGGLGATFYVSYFNTALIFAVLIAILAKVYLVGEDTAQNPLGSADAVFDLLTCSSGPAGNRDQSYLTFFSTGGLMFGVINIIGNFGAVFCDQAYWQSTIAARPLQGVWGFISGGLAWFAIPFSMATTVGLAFVALSTRSGKELLSAEDVDKGLVASVVVNQLMGHTGQAILLLMLLMAVMSTGSAEVIAVTSIIVYDIYKDYISPFRRDLEEDDCVLCGMKRENPVSEDEKCFCHPISSCTKCHEENHARAQPTGFHQYTCPTHAAYRNYLDMLLGKKNIYIVVVTVATVPLVLLADAAGLNLGWLYLFMGVLIGAAVIPIGMALFWARTTAAGMISGATVGCVLALICWLGTAASFPGGLGGGNFIKNSGDQVSMIVGNLVSILSGGAICAVVSIVQSYDKTEDELMREWEKTRSVDNPLKPWGPTYQSAYKMTSANKLNDRPSFEEIRRFCRRPRMTALIAGIGLSLVLVIIWPAGMLGVGVMNGSEFQHWVNVSQTWAFLAAAFVIVVPLVQEVVSIYKNYRANKEHGKGDQEVYQNGTATTGLPPDATVTRL
ncbi:urea-proton symporter DUR3-like [Branchiostoma floridae]|uniref:Urea-proton symporter DUR3-like n=1 Tax=Branchiostoma floridae TaxID=7739 RepID=A0A9J7LHI0_BRAFL|nr:urea-proton symporter DUR3-like [Branchiostoma floridae]